MSHPPSTAGAPTRPAPVLAAASIFSVVIASLLAAIILVQDARQIDSAAQVVEAPPTRHEERPPARVGEFAQLDLSGDLESRIYRNAAEQEISIGYAGPLGLDQLIADMEEPLTDGTWFCGRVIDEPNNQDALWCAREVPMSEFGIFAARSDTKDGLTVEQVHEFALAYQALWAGLT